MLLNIRVTKLLWPLLLTAFMNKLFPVTKENHQNQCFKYIFKLLKILIADFFKLNIDANEN